MPRSRKYLKPEELRRLEEIRDDIAELVREAARMIRHTDEWRSAEVYWYGHILSALGDDDYPEGSATTMKETIQALDRDYEDE
jgi:hypothetical protein